MKTEESGLDEQYNYNFHNKMNQAVLDELITITVKDSWHGVNLEKKCKRNPMFYVPQSNVWPHQPGS